MKRLFNSAGRFAVAALMLLLSTAFSLQAQTTTYTSGPLSVDITKFNPCNGLNNGYLLFKVNSTSDGTPATINIILGPVNLLSAKNVAVGATYTHNPTKTLPVSGSGYQIIISDPNGSDVISTFGSPIVLGNFPTLGETDNGATDLTNSSCSTPDGQIAADITGGSQTTGSGSYSYTFSATNSLAGLPFSGTFDGTTTLDLATLLGDTGLPGGDYTLNVSDDYSQCTTTKNWTISDPQPATQVVSNAGGQTVCAGQNATVNLAGSEVGVNYEVLINGSPSGVTQAGTGGALVFTVPSGSFSNGQALIVQATLGICTPKIMTGSVVMTVNPLPTANISGTTAICAGGSTMLTFTLPAAGTYNVVYTDGTSTFNANGISNGATVSVSPGSSTTYTITSVTNAATLCGVTAPSANITGSAVITVNPLPTANISGTATVCVGGSTNLTFGLPAGTYNVVYTDGSSNFSANGISNGATVAVSPAANTTYTIVSVTNAATLCSVTAPSANITGNAVVTVNPLPTASISGTTAICAGSSTNLTFTLSAGTYDVVYTDGTSNFTAIGISNGATVSVNPAANTTYTIVSITNTSIASCTVTAPSPNITGSAVITVNPAPTASISGTATICAGGSTLLTFTLPAVGTYDVVYTDGTSNFTANGISNGATVSVSPASSVTYTIVSVTNTATSCASVAPSANITGSAVITVNPLPSGSVAGTTTICTGGSTNLTFSLPAGTYNVVYTDGSSNFTLNGISNGATTSVNPAATTTYTIVSITNAVTLCAVTAPNPAITGSAVVTVNPLPTASISGTASICAGGSTNLTFTLSAGTYDVVYTDGSSNFTASGISNGATVSVSPAANTTYTIVSITNTSIASCTVSAPSPNITGSAVITVNSLPTASISGTTTICVTGSATLTFTLPAAGTFNVVYTDGTTNFNANGIANGATVSVSPAATTTYTIVSVTNAATLCSVTAPSPSITGSAVITVNPLPTASISGTTTICQGSSTLLTFTLSAGTYNVVYTNGVGNFNANNISSGATVSVSPGVTRTFTIVSVTNTATASCTVTAPSPNITGSAVVTVNPLPTASISGTTTICAGASTNLTFTLSAGTFDVVYSDGTSNFTATGITNGATVSVSPASTTTYTIKSVTNTASLCSVTAPSVRITGSAVITVNPLPSGSISGPATICVGGSATLTFTLPAAGTFNVVYTDGTTNFNANGIVNGATVSVNPASTVTYTIVSVTNAATLCSVSAPSPSITGSAVITVNPLPTASISGTTTICAGASTNLMFTLSAGTYDVVYTDGITNFNANGISSGATVSVSPAATTTYTIVSITNTTTPSCTVTAPSGNITGSAVITVDPLPTADISGTTTICAGANTNLTFTLPAGAYDVVYTDGTTNFNANGISNGATVSVSPASTTTYTIVSVVNTATTCSVAAPNANITGSAVITVNPLPTGDISGTTSICVGGNTNLMFTLPAGTYDVVYTDGTSNFTASGISNGATVSVSPAVNTTYTIVSVTNTATLCSVTAPSVNITGSAVITLIASPTADISGTATICVGGSTNLTFTLGGGTYDVVYTDGTTNFNANGIANGATVSVSPVANTTYTIVSVKDNVSGCMTTAPNVNITGSAIITVNPTPIASISGTTSICVGGSTNLTFNLGGSTYDVVYTDGTTNFNANGISNGATVSVSPASTTTYTIVSVTDNVTTCTATVPDPGITGSAVITVTPLPTADISGTATICGGTSTLLTFTLPAGTYDVDYTDGTSTFTASGIANGATVSVSPLVNTTYTISKVTNTASLCSVTAPDPAITGSAAITVTTPPNAGTNNSNTACNTNNAFNLFTSLGGTPDVGGSWTDVDGSGGVITGDNIDLTAVAPGVYHFDYTVTGAAPCPNATATVTLTVISGTPDAGSDNTVSGCDADTAFDLFASISGTPNPGGTWTDLDASGATITGNLVNLNGLGGGTFRYQYTLTVVGCGSASSIVTVQVITSPNAGLPGNGNACNADNAYDLFAQLAGTPSAGGVWTDLDASGAVISGNLANLTSVAAGTYRYQYTVSGTAPCPNATAIVTINVIQAPNAGTFLVPSVPACTTDNAFSLIGALTGTPDAGGTWTDLDASGAVIAGNNADLTTVTAGSYRFQYTVTGTAPCADASTIITIQINRAPNAGLDNNVATCNNALAFDLTGSLLGTPDVGGTWTDVSGTSGAVITGSTADLTGVSVSGAYQYLYTVTGTAPCVNATATLTLNITVGPDAGADAATTACNTNNAFDLFASLGGTPSAGGSWTDVDGSGGVITGNNIDLTTVAVGTYHFTYTVLGTAPCANATATVTVDVINTTPDPGTDNTVQGCNSDNAFDLFTSLGGTPNPGGSWTDMDASGATITGDNVNLTTLAAGTYRYQYTINVGGCGSASAIVTVQVQQAPNAGIDGAAAVCSSNAAFDLFAVLTGGPTAGGTWTDMDLSGAVITGTNADFTTVAAGTYRFQYTVTGTAPCTNVSSIVTVTITTAPNSGVAVSPNLSDCNTDAAFDLTTTLIAPFDAGGTWTDLTGSGAVISTNNVDFTGVAASMAYQFQYTVAGSAPCVAAQTTVTVQVNKAPNAGTNKTVAICGATNSYNLFTNLGGTPDVGGTWTDLGSSGAVITGNTADFTAVATGSYQFQYTVNGTAPCPNATAILTVNVTAGPTVAKAGLDQILCGTTFTNLSANSPAGGEIAAWSVSPAGGVALPANGPTALFVGSAGTSYTLTWIISNGACPPSTDQVVINFAASPTSSSPVTACVNATAPTLNANAVGATSIQWYKDATLTTLLFTGNNFTPAAADLDMTTTGTTSFYVVAVYGCGNSLATKVDVNVSNSGVCGGGGGGGGLCAQLTSIVITPTEPTCASPDGGALKFELGANSYDVIIEKPGLSQTQRGSTVTFTDLKAGDYLYTIKTFGGTVNTCVDKATFRLDKFTQVIIDSAYAIVGPSCFGQNDGTVTVAARNTTTGQYFFTYVNNGIESAPMAFNPSQPFPVGFPGNDLDSILIKVDETAAMLCPATINVKLDNQHPKINTTFVVTPTTCGVSAGTVTTIAGSGGSGGPFTFALDGINGISFDSLSAGQHILVTTDGASGCTRTDTVNIGFPGQIAFSVASNDATCSNQGASGQINVTFPSPDNYKVGLSLSPNIEPTTYNDVLFGNLFYTFDNVVVGNYYVFVKGSGATCPTPSPVVVIGGATHLSFHQSIVCDNNNVTLKLDSVTYASQLPLNLAISFTDVNGTVLPDYDEQPVLVNTEGNIIISPTDPTYTNLFAATGIYKFFITQLQSGAFGFCDMKSNTDIFTIRPQLQIPTIATTESFSDATDGQIMLTDFNGGLAPYYVELDNTINEVPLDPDYRITLKNLAPGPYTLFVSDSLGCEIEISTVVPEDKSIFIPNIFTPNDDATNNAFEIRNLPDDTKTSIVITNRWGKQVYASNDYKDHWWKAEGLDDGVYFYSMKVGSVKRSGWVEVLRGVKP